MERDGQRHAAHPGSGVAAVIPVTLRPGQRLRGDRGAEFTVVEWVGEGSYARVYRAEGGPGAVALKLAKEEIAGAETRLRTECEAHARVAHAAIPALLDMGHTEPAAAAVPWLARRWIEGSSLRQCLDRDRSLPLARAVPVLLRLADAVSSLHAAGWSHGDLRPENVLIETGTRDAYLLDLGEARPLANPAPRVSPDLLPLVALLAWCLTGVDPATAPDRLALAAGYHPAAVQLWQEARQGRLASVIGFRDRLRQLARQLGLPTEGKRRA